MKEDSSPHDVRSVLARAAKIAVVLLAILLGGLTVTAWYLGDQSNLPVDYDGFD